MSKWDGWEEADVDSWNLDLMEEIARAVMYPRIGPHERPMNHLETLEPAYAWEEDQNTLPLGVGPDGRRYRLLLQEQPATQGEAP